MTRQLLFPICLLVCLYLPNATTAQPLLYEDFDGGLPADWSAIEVTGNQSATSNWVHTTVGPQGELAQAPLSSTTSENGWMLFDSFTDCNTTDGQEAWLISPEITNTTTGQTVLFFETIFRRYNDDVFIRIGTDLQDLSSWQTINLFEDVDFLETAGHPLGEPFMNPTPVEVDITDAINGLGSFYIGFQYLSNESTKLIDDVIGCNFSWQIDDVTVTELVDDVALFDPADLENYITPLSLAERLIFGVKLDNRGSVDITNPMIQITIEKDGAIAYDTTQTLEGTQSAGSASDGFIGLSGNYTPDGIGTYTLTYRLLYDDDNPLNNEVRRNFFITDNVLGKDDATPAVNATRADNQNNYQIGSYYFIPKSGEKAMEVTFSAAFVAPDHVGQVSNVFLYKIAQDNNNAVFNDNDVIIVGTGSYEYQESDESFGLFSVPLNNLVDGQQGVELEANMEYFLMVEYTPDFFVPYTTNPYFELPSTVIKVVDGWFPGGYQDNYITVISRLRLEGNAVDVNELELAPDQFTIFPNPANQRLQVNYQLKAASELVQLRLTTTEGRLLDRKIFENSSAENFEWNVQQLPSGQYWLHIQSAEGVATRKVIVQR